MYLSERVEKWKDIKVNYYYSSIVVWNNEVIGVIISFESQTNFLSHFFFQLRSISPWITVLVVQVRVGFLEQWTETRIIYKIELALYSWGHLESAISEHG